MLAGQRVFVTSNSYNGNLKGALANGFVGADRKCADEAYAAGLPGGVWKAVLSSSTVAASSNVTIGRNVYNISASPGRIATDSTDFFDGAHAEPILQPNGSSWVGSNLRVWSNFNDTGVIPGGSLHCNDWTDGTSGLTGNTINHENANSSGWASLNLSKTCSSTARLYCISQ